MAPSLSVVLRDVLRARRFSELASLFPALGFASIDAYRHSVLAPRTQRSLNCTTQHSVQTCAAHHVAFLTGTQLADGRAWPSDNRRLRFGHRRMLRAVVPWRLLPQRVPSDCGGRPPSLRRAHSGRCSPQLSPRRRLGCQTLQDGPLPILFIDIHQLVLHSASAGPR